MHWMAANRRLQNATQQSQPRPNTQNDDNHVRSLLQVPDREQLLTNKVNTMYSVINSKVADAAKVYIKHTANNMLASAYC